MYDQINNCNCLEVDFDIKLEKKTLQGYTIDHVIYHKIEVNIPFDLDLFLLLKNNIPCQMINVFVLS